MPYKDPKKQREYLKNYTANAANAERIAESKRLYNRRRRAQRKPKDVQYNRQYCKTYHEEQASQIKDAKKRLYQQEKEGLALAYQERRMNLSTRWVDFQREAAKGGKVVEDAPGMKMLLQSIITGVPCHYCGEKAYGVDRYDNSIRVYSPLNTVPACTTCNFVKGKLNGDEFVLLCRKIAGNRAADEYENDMEKPSSKLLARMSELRQKSAKMELAHAHKTAEKKAQIATPKRTRAPSTTTRRRRSIKPEVPPRKKRRLRRVQGAEKEDKEDSIFSE